MTRFRYLGISLLTCLFLIPKVSATSCGYEEKAKLNSEVANIKANYEIKERVLDPSEYAIPDAIVGTEEEATYVAKSDYIQINVLNLTENMYAEIKNGYEKQTKRYNYSDTDNGNIAIEWHKIGSKNTYTIKIYTSSNTGCEGEVLKTLYVSVPRYNDYSSYHICKDIPDYYLCQEYVTFEQVPFSEFYEKVTKQIEKSQQEEEKPKTDKWYEKVIDFVVDHKVAFISGGIILVVAAGVSTAVIIRKRRRSII